MRFLSMLFRRGELIQSRCKSLNLNWKVADQRGFGFAIFEPSDQRRGSWNLSYCLCVGQSNSMDTKKFRNVDIWTQTEQDAATHGYPFFQTSTRIGDWIAGLVDEFAAEINPRNLVPRPFFSTSLPSPGDPGAVLSASLGHPT
jgi:hypothetical protein